jgi:hypothetical protein
MAERTYLLSIVQWTLWAVIMAAIGAWMSKARKKPASGTDPRVLAYPLSALVLALVCVLLFGAFTVVTLFAAAGNAPWWTTAIFGVFTLASLHFLADTWVARYHVSEEGLRYTSVFVRDRLFKWAEIRSVKYASNMKWFVVKDSGTHVARVSTMMSGLPVFAQLLINNVEQAAIDSSTLAILKQTARGEPPSVWP